LTLRDNQICNDEKTACVIVSLRQLSSGRDRFKAILFVAALPSRLSRYSLWQFRSAASVVLVEYARERLSKELAVSGASTEAVNCAKHLFDPKYLTLGFARRYHCRNPQLLATSPAAMSMQ
jgi:hypothetical protein